MTHFKRKPLLSLLLALVMVVTMLPMSALAAEETDIPATEVCTDEHCTHEHESAETADVYTVQPDTEQTGFTEDTPVTASDEEILAEEATASEADAEVALPEPEADEIPAVPETAPETPAASGDYPFTWVVDAEGTLYITGDGYVEPFYSPDEQPWRDIREQIHSVCFDLSAALEIIDLCHWFDGCINLSNAAIPVYVCQVAPSDFTDCFLLSGLTYGGVDVIAEIKADYSNQPDIEFESEGKPSNSGISLLSASNCGVLQCTCSGSCSWGYKNYRVAPESNNYHIMTVYCITCGKTDGIIVSGNHSYCSNGYCSLCGYYNSAYDTTICYHTSTRQSWVTSCRWERYCTNCGAFVSSGTTHGPYDYGAWQYYSSSQHRRSYTCTYGDSGTYYEYCNHSTTTSYGQYNATQHSVQSYCSTCGSYIGSASYASHSFSYGSWQSYNGTQHRRLKTCSLCGYSEYEYSNHSLSYGSWTNYSASQHRRSVSCTTCGYSSYEYANHSLTSGVWASISDTQHQRNLSCSCGYSTTETADHSLSYGAWTAISDAQHQRTGSCSCGYSASESGDHADADDNGYCDACDYLMTRFSVTVPASLPDCIGAWRGLRCQQCAIINNSTGAVEVTGITLTAANGWALVPYNYNMAAAQVITKLIGFSQWRVNRHERSFRKPVPSRKLDDSQSRVSTAFI